MTAFWFAPESPRPLALMRIGVGLVLLWETAWHAPFVVETYSTAGRPMPAVAFVDEGTVPPVPSPAFAVALHGWLLFALGCVAVGLRTRASLVVAAALLGYLSLLDFPGTLTKYTAIGLHLLVLLAVSGSHGVWSLDAWFLGPRDRTSLPAAWPRRLVQLLLCHVYLGAVVTKIRAAEFAVGETLAFSLIDDRWSGGWLGAWPGAWLATHPRAVVLASFATIAFEVAFPLLVWFRRTRRPMLVLAVLFHVALAAGMSLSIFTPLMCFALLAFVEERDLADVRRLWGRPALERRSFGGHVAERTKSTVGPTLLRRGLLVGAWLLLGGGAAATSYGLHRGLDPYGAFGGESPALVEVPRGAAETLLAGPDPPAAVWVHRIDVGHRWSNYQTFGDDRTFRPGDSVTAQVRLDNEHPPLEVRVVLVDAQGTTAAEIADYVPLGGTHRWFRFPPLTAAFPAGRARLRFHVEGELVEEREFEFVTE
jgi:hypothetical protein